MTMKGISKDDVEWFSPEELAAAREEYLQEQEKEQPSSQVQKDLLGGMCLFSVCLRQHGFRDA